MTLPLSSPAPAPLGVLRRAEAWLDAQGRAAWIAAMVLGFLVYWPIGLALVFYITWTKRWSTAMFGLSCRSRSTDRPAKTQGCTAGWGRTDRGAFRPSGNVAFDSYKADTLRRLEEEQEAFEAFLHRLRQAKDKSEFDSFMEDRARQAEAHPATQPDDAMPTETARRGEY